MLTKLSWQQRNDIFTANVETANTKIYFFFVVSPINEHFNK